MADTAIWTRGNLDLGLLRCDSFEEYNPLRWSDPALFADTYKRLQDEKENGEMTAVWVKVPGHMSSKTVKHASIDEAVAGLKTMVPAIIGNKEWEQAKTQLQSPEEQVAELPQKLACAEEKAKETARKAEETRAARRRRGPGYRRKDRTQAVGSIKTVMAESPGQVDEAEARAAQLK